MQIRELWFSELQQKGIIKVVWVSGYENETNIQTTNLAGQLFEKHAEVYCGDDKYDCEFIVKSSHWK